MSNTILIKRSSTPNAVPAANSISQGELAINLVDGNLFYKNSTDQVTVIASNKFLTVSGQVSAGGNVVGANVSTGGVVTATGTITGGNLVTAGTVSATGNITGNYILGNGALLTGIDAASIQNGTSNVRVVSSGGNVTISVGGTSNVAVFSTGGVVVTGNVDAGNINGNGSGLSSITGANVTGQVGNALVAGTVYTAAQPNITSVGTLTSVSVTGNVDAGNVNGNGSGLSSITGANVTGQVGNALVAGTVYTAAQPNITSVGTLTSVSVTGNVDSGNVNATRGAFSTVAGTLETAAQPNITSVGTLSSLSVSGTVTGGNLATAGTASAGGNITGGNIATAGTVSAGGNITGNYFLGNGSQLTGVIAVDVGTLASLSVTGNIVSGNVSAVGNVVAANLVTAGGLFAADGLFTGNLTVDGNVTYINIENLTVQDPIIGLGRGPNNTPLTTNDGKDRGTEMWYYTDAEKAAFMGYHNLSGKMIAASNVTLSSDVVTVNEYGTLVVGTLEGATVSVTGTVTGGNISTAGTGNIATLEITTLANIKATTAASSTTTGALRVAGGVGVVGNIYAGDVYSTGNLVLTVESTVDGGTY